MNRFGESETVWLLVFSADSSGRRNDEPRSVYSRYLQTHVLIYAR